MMTPDDLTPEQLKDMQDACGVAANKFAKTKDAYDDFKQLALLKVITTLGNWDPERGTFYLYCYVVAMNSIKAELTRRNRTIRIATTYAASIDVPRTDQQQSLSDLLAAPVAADPFASETIRVMLGEVFETLTPIERLAFALHCCARFSQVETADAINKAKVSKKRVTAKSVDNALQRARRKLQAFPLFNE